VDRWEEEHRLWASGLRVAGLDEVGTGAWAGPVVAGCVAFLDPDGLRTHAEWDEVNDSKKLQPKVRDRLDGWIRDHAAVGVGFGTVEEIAQMNVLRASLLAMERALEALTDPGGERVQVDHLLVDARTVPGFRGPQTALIGGDGRSGSIGAASIVAKVARDRFMTKAGESYPAYGFADHKGYGTARHRAALEAVGACPLHRSSFLPTRPSQLSLW